MGLDFTASSYAKMAAAQRKLTEALNAINREGCEAGLAAFALVRLSRELLNKYPEETRTMLVEQVIIPFLRNEPADDEGGRIIRLH